MKKEQIKNRVSLVISKLHYDKETRNLKIFGSNKEIENLPYETEFKKRLFPGHQITVITYIEDGAHYKMVQQGDEIIGHYGPMEKFKRDQYYKVEVTRKVSGL